MIGEPSALHVFKFVYCGPVRSGKSANLRALDRLVARSGARGLVEIPGPGKASIFPEFLHFSLKLAPDSSLRLHLLAVSGKRSLREIQRLALKGLDGVVFVVDSRRSESVQAQRSFQQLLEDLQSLEVDLSQLPLIIQFNKRDLPDVRSDEEIDELAAMGREPVFKSIASRGIGVLDTLLAMTELAWQRRGLPEGVSQMQSLRQQLTSGIRA